MNSLEALYLRAWIDGLKARSDAPAVLPAAPLPRLVPLRDTDRARYVRLRSVEP